MHLHLLHVAMQIGPYLHPKHTDVRRLVSEDPVAHVALRSFLLIVRT